MDKHQNQPSSPLLAGYLDDGRQCTTTLRPGMRFSKSENRFEYSKAAEIEDENKRLAGESRNQRMARICLPAMNSINEDLEFTVESQEEFENEQLPTLDFTLWINEIGELNHTYYQKPMKTPLVLMARSAMSSQQKVQILSNELTRRIFNINQENNGLEEYKKVINRMTQEMKNSEYNYSTTRQVVISGIRGLRTRMEMRTRKGQEKYRLGATTVKARERKKLLAKESWYKDGEQNQERSTQAENNPGKAKNKNKQRTKVYLTVSVMFVPYTPGGVLAKKLRENEEKIANITKNRVKIVERTGTKLQDVLTKANPWKGIDCTRKNCLLCHTKMKTEKNENQDCHKRSLVYEIKCLTCEKRELEKIEKNENTKKREQIKQFKYIGETSRSSYERGWEHLNDLAQLKSSSHMLKHIVGEHPGQDMAEVEFGMKVLKFTQSSFERQIRESVVIQVERQKHHLLNSRTEYNRCSLPRLSTQVGEGEYKQYTKELEEEKRHEETIENKIRELRKERNKARLHPTREQGPSKKKRKINEEEYINIQEIWDKPKMSTTQKREQETEESQAKKKMRNQNVGPSIKLTNMRTIETPHENKEIQLDMDWDERIKQRRKEIEEEEYKREQKLQYKEIREQTWALNRLCRRYLEENDKDWARTKELREQEQKRKLRLEKAGLMKRNAQIREIEKKIEIGMEKLPQKEREQLIYEENKTRLLELAEAKKNLWKMRTKEKKINREHGPTEIQKLGLKAEKIASILQKERERVRAENERKELEKEKIEKIRNEKLTMEMKRKEKLEKARKLQEHYALYRLTTEYIDENKSVWENERKVREQERKEKIERWEKKNRMEKIRELRRIQKEKQEKQTSPENLDEEDAHCIAAAEKIEELENKNWKVWRTTKSKESTRTENKHRTEPTEKKIYPIFNMKIKEKIEIKLREPKLKRKRSTSTDFQDKDDAHCIESAESADPPKKQNSQETEQDRETKKAPETEGPEQTYCSTTPNKQHPGEAKKVDRVQRSTTSTATNSEQQEATTNTNNEKNLQYQTSRTVNTADKEKRKYKIEQYFPVQSTKQQQQRTTSTNAATKKRNNKTTTKNKKEIEKMQKFMSQFKVSKRADNSLPIQLTDGSSDGKNSSEESHSLMTSARQSNKSESEGFAAPTNLMGGWQVKDWKSEISSG